MTLTGPLPPPTVPGAMAAAAAAGAYMLPVGPGIPNCAGAAWM